MTGQKIHKTDFFAKKRPLVEKIKTWNWLDIQWEIFLCVEYR